MINFRKIVCILLASFCLASVFAAKTPIKEANDESEMWYEFKAKILKKQYKVFAFKTDEQLMNRGIHILNKNGWGVNEEESVEQFFAMHRFEKTVIYDELKAELKKRGNLKYACIINKVTTKDETTIHLYTFWYDAETDTLYTQSWAK